MLTKKKKQYLEEIPYTYDKIIKINFSDIFYDDILYQMLYADVACVYTTKNDVSDSWNSHLGVK